MGITSRSSSRRSKIRGRQAKTPFLSLALQKFIAHRLTDMGGTVFATTGGTIFLMLISYDERDPSLNTTALDYEIHNIFGVAGSYTADLLLQTLGLASYFIALAMIVWGYRIVARLPLENKRGKLFLLFLSVLFASIAFAKVPSSWMWGTGSTMGGSFGSLLFNGLGKHLRGWMGTMAFLFVSICSFVAFVATYIMALGISVQGWLTGLREAKDRTLQAHGFIADVYERFQHWHQSHASVSDYDYVEEEVEGETEKQTRTRRKRVSVDQDAAVEVPETPVRPIVVPRQDKAKAESKKEPQQKKLDLRNDEDWVLPSVDMLDEVPPSAIVKLDEAAIHKNAEMLRATLNDFGVHGEILKVSPGPIVTLYEMEPAPGTKTSRVVGLSDDIARSMSSVSVRVAVVPGKNAIGIELPNAKRETVYLKDSLCSKEYQKTQAKLPLILGKNIAGDPVIADLARMPHLLVAGTTGSGKSVAVNTMLLSLLYRFSPEQCRFIMIDPKMLELSVYDDIPHLLTPVVTEPHRAIIALKWAVREMEDRYRMMSKLGVRNIDGFNERVREARKKGEVLMHRVQTGFDLETGKPVWEEQPIPLVDLPYIVIIVDEFADLMLVAGKEVENAIQRLAQMARAAGLHLIMATQRPSVDVVTGIIKANFPTRISFQVTSRIDSRTILGEGGAEQLLGQGDMLYMASGGRVMRVHGPFVSDHEVERVVKYLRSMGEPNYVDGVTEDTEGGETGTFGEGGGEGADALYDQAVAIVLRERKVSTSFIQRHLQIGYNRAARIVERMEKEGLVSAANHVGKRDILVDNYGT